MKKIQLAVSSIVITQVIPLLGKPELILNYKNIIIMAANASLWLFQPAFSAKETTENKSNDKYSVVLIIVMSVLSTIIPIVDWAYFSDPNASNTAVTVAGFIIMWFGVVLRNYSIKILGKHFTPTIQLQNDHTLITSGPYSIIRHPSYLGALLAIVGIAIFLNSSIGAISAVIAMMIAYTIRINAEEKVLKSLFGNVYSEYQKRTKKLIPFLW
ncbi:MAG: isoprenylcysteine carboxylmethyltransferase family protein [Segetibacter sp.]|nr:isoprenylcysteine carboxylmethyltransferase family protein [Segetibacter sp.]